MRLTLKALAVIAAMLFAQTVLAKDAVITAEKVEAIAVNIAPAVQEQLKKASPDQRKTLEAAIHTGNLFIPLHFSSKAYDLSPENTEWDDETAPLLALDREQWTQQYESSNMNRKKILLGNEAAYTTRLVCPQVSLIAVQQGGETTTLVYRTTAIGTEINYRGDLYEFNLEGGGETYDIRIELDSTSLVNKVMLPDQWVTWSYTASIDVMKRFLGDHGYAGASSKEHINEMIKAYEQSISKMEKSAARFCK